MQAEKKSNLKKRKSANALMYAAKPAPANHLQLVKNATIQDPKLRRILVETLDALKRPDAVPSKVIYEALEKASKVNE